MADISEYTLRITYEENGQEYEAEIDLSLAPAEIRAGITSYGDKRILKVEILQDGGVVSDVTEQALGQIGDDDGDLSVGPDEGQFDPDERCDPFYD